MLDLLLGVPEDQAGLSGETRRTETIKTATGLRAGKREKSGTDNEFLKIGLGAS